MVNLDPFCEPLVIEPKNVNHCPQKNNSWKVRLKMMIFYWRQLQTFTHQIYGRVGLLHSSFKKNYCMALSKDIRDSQKQKIFVFQVAGPFICFLGVYSFTQWHRASPFYLPLLDDLLHRFSLSCAFGY